MSHRDDALIGQVLDDYKIERLLGKGGMSKVYKALEQTMSREVALKVITLERDRAKELMRRFQREARASGKLYKHNNIVTIFRYGSTSDDRHYLAMELVEGETLTQRLGRYKRNQAYMPYGEIISIMRQIADALDYAHQNNIIHRDIKPSNIMLERKTERAVLMDFGLVMEIKTDDNSTLGTAFGTPRYIAPEQAISSHQAVPQSDIYSLGVIVYEMLTSKTPFEDESAMSLALSHITSPPPSPREFRPELPGDAVNVIMKVLEKQPEDRYQTAMELVDALEVALLHDEAMTAAPATTSVTTTVASDVTEDVPLYTPTPASPSQAAVRIKSPKKLDAGEEKRRNWLPYLALLVMLIVGAGAVLLLSGGNDESAGDGRFSGEDIVLVYDSESFTFYNASDHIFNITGLKFVADLTCGSEFCTHDTQFWGATETVPNITPNKCIHIYHIEDQVPLPDFCQGDDSKDIPLRSRIQQSYYWVWADAENDTGQFGVIYNGQQITTCQTSDQRCTFSLPQSMIVTETPETPE